MKKLKASQTTTLEIKWKEFLKYAIPLIPREDMEKEIISELYQTVCGIVGGDYGGQYYDDWEHIFYRELDKNGFIKQTQASINRFGLNYKI